MLIDAGTLPAEQATAAGRSTAPSTHAARSACWPPAATGSTAATSSPPSALQPPWKRCGHGPEADFLKARAARLRGDLAGARTLIAECRKDLPGSPEFAAFAEEVGAEAPR